MFTGNAEEPTQHARTRGGIRRAVFVVFAAAWAAGTALGGVEAPVCGGPCSACAEAEAGNGGRMQVGLESVDFDGTNTTFTYRVCEDQTSQNLSHWVVGLSEACCDQVVDSFGGTGTTAVCELDPTTEVFGVKWDTDGGVPSCEGPDCATGGELFTLTLYGHARTECVTVVGKINSGASQAYACVSGPACGCLTDVDCDDGNLCTGTETCSSDGHCLPGVDISDCNGNGFDDGCDIADGTSEDCDGNGVPDKCDPPDDCNGNGVQDICDVAEGTSGDCNGNRIPDDCEAETDCNANGVQDICDLATGTSPDCNGNGVPDECDVANCIDVVACDDCNLNGVPDGCDIDSGGSLDVDPVDGIPDECVGPAQAGGDWTDDIWDLGDEDPDNPYPDDDDGVADLHVTIDGFSVFLDDTVQVQSLRLLNGGTLFVTQEVVGDFSAAAAGGILNEGNLVVGNDRRIDLATAPLTIGPGGLYARAFDATAVDCPDGLVCATLSAGDVTITAGDCTSGRSGGVMDLDEAMSVEIAGDLTLLGSDSFECVGTSGARLRGINVPPQFQIGGDGKTIITGSFIIEDVAESTNKTSAQVTAASANRDAGPLIHGMTLLGDFVNRSISPSLFDWIDGSLLMSGVIQVFEVAGLDLGPIPEGFYTEKDTLFDFGPHKNFAIGDVEVASGSHVTFVNAEVNTAGAGPCLEALYVDRLVLQAGSAVTLDDTKVYYRSLEDHGATIETLGCGGLLGLCDAVTPTADSTAKNRFVSFSAGVPGRDQAIRVTFEDLPPPLDLLDGVSMWVAEPFDVSESSITADPTAGFGTFKAATLQCEPFFMDWSTVGMVHVFHEAIVPGGLYPVQVIDQTCGASAEADFSPPLTAERVRTGDVVSDCTTDPCGPPNGSIDILDVMAVVGKFALRPGSVDKVRADLEPQLPDFVINITDALYVVDAFGGHPFVFVMPEIPCID